jgi:hypothetical protein
MKMNVSDRITKAMFAATRNIRYPGPWFAWEQEQPLDKFLLELMQRPAEPDTTAWGRVIWRSPIRDALGALPYIYRSAVHHLMAEYFYGLLVHGERGDDPTSACRLMHDNLSTVRSLLAARLRTNHDEFAEATTPIEVAHQHAWQNDASEVKSDAEGTTVWASCSLEQALDDFATALAERELNWATSLITQVAGEKLGSVDWDGWDAVALDRIPVLSERDGTITHPRKKAKEQLKTPRMRFWAVNKLYRALVKEQWSLQSLYGYWEYRMDRALKEQGRPLGEAYAGSEPEMLQIGRIEHVVSDEGFDAAGHREGGPEREVLNLIESELTDLEVLINQLEAMQLEQAPVWKLVGQEGVPYWYDRSGACYTTEQKVEAMAAREAQREEWMRSRDMVMAQTLTKEELKLLAELTKFDTNNAE